MDIRWCTMFLDLPDDAGFDAAVRFWRSVTGSGLSTWREAGTFATLLPPSGDSYLRIQRVRSGGGNHLDLDVDADALTAAVAQALSLGAGVDHEEEGLVVLHSPGGMPLCLAGVESRSGGGGGSVVPSPVDVGGVTSRLDQLCLDVPPAVYEAECAFWAGLTGWPLRHTTPSEFSYLERPAGQPVRILLQCVDEAPDGAKVTAHPDFACSDKELLAERHVALGATVVARFPDWTVLADPAGRPYCLTRRTP